MEGFDPGAIWEDQKLGFAHFFDWERCAVVTDVAWASPSRSSASCLGSSGRAPTGRFRGRRRRSPRMDRTGLTSRPASRPRIAGSGQDSEWERSGASRRGADWPGWA
ncbi:SpoIIAA family protein [Mycolicibacterium aubagnense]|uniref:STAS/SEC14 domain-containing protein n=1 Tax=Mycolicibacterium aubagnense TaxID=319707 RepID=UPI0038990969